ncbi:epsin-2 isoform X2 [Microplitis demolitor]|uniref:epsin-2 isoform X2 n=1 Tax=Microplitis demolitor TaxID=69319 RepID=UPI0004CC91FD|nr:epsin-2 isoform X2 [Microplitis demolitor]
MRKQGQDVMQVNLAGIRRDILNLAHNYSLAQKLVRKATSNDPWGPSSTLMAEIADLTYNVVAFTEIMQMLWKRLNDHGKNWRHVYKALIVLDYLIKTGSEKVAQQCKENIFAIQTLKDFQYMDGIKDQGINVREKAKQLVALLKDDERLRNERARALKAKERFAQSASGFGSDGLDAMSTLGDLCSPDWEPYRGKSESKPELEAARPQTVGEEELQLQLALAMSREEAEQEEQRRRSDDVRLQLALSQSQQDFKAPPAEKQSHMLDLLDVNLGEASGGSQQVDPWGVPIVPPPPRPQSLDLSRYYYRETHIDPWSAPTISSATAAAPLDPWSPVPPQRPTSVDPWRAPAPSPATVASPARTGTAGTTGTTVDPWSLAPTTTEALTTPSTSFNNSTSLTPPNIGFNVVQPPQNIGFNNISSPSASGFNNNNSNGFSSSGTSFNNFNSSPNQGSTTTSPSGDFDEFDIISNRNKIRSSPQPVNNGGTMSPDPFNFGTLNDNLPASTGAVKKTPQSFLGENSALVNLDNLVSTSTIKLSTPAATVSSAFTANPFATVTPPPRPTINQIRQDPWTGNGSNSTTANPFLS